jgi:geranylgeranyl diphosphate synthase type II
MENINDWLLEQVELVNACVARYLPLKDNTQNQLYKSMRYSLEAGGKRIRPILMLTTFNLFNQKSDRQILPFACAVEMIHTYSLIHDDLPAMDNDELRRGKPTNHIVFGEAMAILAGDALLNKSVEVILENRHRMGLSEDTLLSCLSALMTASGTEGMIGGQVMDMFGRIVTQTQLAHMHQLKTGALIEASCHIGALAGEANQDELDSIISYARNLGLAFQIKDDILDHTETTAMLGKTAGSDIINEKTTYVSLLGLDEAKKLLNSTTDQAIKSLAPLGNKGERLKSLAKYLLTRKK